MKDSGHAIVDPNPKHASLSPNLKQPALAKEVPCLQEGPGETASSPDHMSYSENSLRQGYIGDYIEEYYGLIQGDARSLDCRSHRVGFCSGLRDFGFRIWGWVWMCRLFLSCVQEIQTSEREDPARRWKGFTVRRVWGSEF